MRKKLCLFFILFLMISISNQCFASGVPVVDAPSIIQRLEAHLVNLDKLRMLTENTSYSAKEIVCVLHTYRMKLKEFKSYMRQIEGLQHMLSEEDWFRLALTTKKYYGKYKGHFLTELDKDSAGYDTARDELLSEYEDIPRDPKDVQSDAKGLGIQSGYYTQQAEKDYKQYNELKDKLDIVKHHSDQSAERKKEIKQSAEQVKNLGDSSELATLQTLAQQNILLMKQQEQLIELQNHQLLFQEMQSAQNASQRAKRREIELKRLKKLKPTELLGEDSWGSL